MTPVVLGIIIVVVLLAIGVVVKVTLFDDESTPKDTANETHATTSAISNTNTVQTNNTSATLAANILSQSAAATTVAANEPPDSALSSIAVDVALANANLMNQNASNAEATQLVSQAIATRQAAEVAEAKRVADALAAQQAADAAQLAARQAAEAESVRQAAAVAAQQAAAQQAAAALAEENARKVAADAEAKRVADELAAKQAADAAAAIRLAQQQAADAEAARQAAAKALADKQAADAEAARQAAAAVAAKQVADAEAARMLAMSQAAVAARKARNDAIIALVKQADATRFKIIQTAINSEWHSNRRLNPIPPFISAVGPWTATDAQSERASRISSIGFQLSQADPNNQIINRQDEISATYRNYILYQVADLKKVYVNDTGKLNILSVIEKNIPAWINRMGGSVISIDRLRLFVANCEMIPEIINPKLDETYINSPFITSDVNQYIVLQQQMLLCAKFLPAFKMLKDLNALSQTTDVVLDQAGIESKAAEVQQATEIISLYLKALEYSLLPSDKSILKKVRRNFSSVAETYITSQLANTAWDTSKEITPADLISQAATFRTPYENVASRVNNLQTSAAYQFAIKCDGDATYTNTVFSNDMRGRQTYKKQYDARTKGGADNLATSVDAYCMETPYRYGDYLQ